MGLDPPSGLAADLLGEMPLLLAWVWAVGVGWFENYTVGAAG